ncbi:hypothetical protein JCGZ_23863 [Jatropha curcas]|uniref:SHSP domain-containing protein n=1 Tax=Jatropha curcas TaxID=180498 RepID=A0A067L381_JATCU|nr:protein RESTRICTED TEV MOVEMENT 2 [Jatropha curcas]KDP42921.1 hypothetical protein JCGZ_23863 [Jatropha curcas]
MAQINHVVYEDFEPTAEWQLDAGHDTLLVYLPGFKKEQLKVQVTSAGKLKISGERPLDHNKRSRFVKEIQIPLIYETEKISAKYEGGILKIKHLKSPRPASKLQENLNSSSQETQENQELQKPKNELKDDKNGIEKAAEEIPSKKTNENSVPEKKPEKDEEMTNSNGKNSSAVADGLGEAEKFQSNKHEVSQERNGNGESKLVQYKLVFGSLVTEIKKPRKSTNMVVAAGLLVLLIGFYVKS